MTGAIKSASKGQTLVLTLSNPDFKNALGPEMYAAGIEALNAAETSADIRSVVITGEGDVFCAGANLQRLQANRRESHDVQAQSIAALHNWMDSIRTYPKPVIAAVEGAAAGAGFSLALGCDFCVAADNAVFAMSYSKVGLSPDGGGSWHIARTLPRAMACELLMAGDRIGAERLRSHGLINLVCPPGAALSQSLGLAERLNALAPNALASIKELMNDAQGNTLGRQMASEGEHFVRNLYHANGGEGIEAFLQKRAPQYR